MVSEIKVCEKSQGTECKGKNRRDNALEQPGCEEYGAITAELAGRKKHINDKLHTYSNDEVE